MGSLTKEKHVLMMEKENEALRSELQARTPHQAISGRDGATMQNQHGELDKYNETLKQVQQRKGQQQVWAVVNDVAVISGVREVYGKILLCHHPIEQLQNLTKSDLICTQCCFSFKCIVI